MIKKLFLCEVENFTDFHSSLTFKIKGSKYIPLHSKNQF